MKRLRNGAVGKSFERETSHERKTGAEAEGPRGSEKPQLLPKVPSSLLPPRAETSIRGPFSRKHWATIATSRGERIPRRTFFTTPRGCPFFSFEIHFFSVLCPRPSLFRPSRPPFCGLYYIGFSGASRRSAWEATV